jgi:hypothetical protein
MAGRSACEPLRDSSFVTQRPARQSLIVLDRMRRCQIAAMPSATAIVATIKTLRDSLESATATSASAKTNMDVVMTTSRVPRVRHAGADAVGVRVGHFGSLGDCLVKGRSVIGSGDESRLKSSLSPRSSHVFVG